MRNMLGLLAFVLLGLIISVPCISVEMQLPKGWRNPTRAETKDRWRDKGVNRYLWFKADFNGDRVPDKASIMVSDDGHEVGLFAFVSLKDGKFGTFLLDAKEIKYIKVLGISAVAPGVYKTACGKGVRDCPKGEPDEIDLVYSAIDYFKFDSARTYFYWDKSTETFKSIGIDD